MERVLNKLNRFLARRAWLGILLLFLTLPLLAFPDLVFGRQTLYWTDLSWIHYPRRLFAAREWLAGRVPLWDPYEDTGTPLLAESQVGVLYPVSVLFLSPLSPSRELSLFILVHFSLAALFTFVLARTLGLARAPATIAGLAYGFGGFLMAQTANLNIMTGAVWLPLVMYAALQVTRRRTWLAALLAGIPLALQLLTAQPQIVFYTLVIVASYGLYRIGFDFFSRSGPGYKRGPYALRTALLLAGAVFSGLLLAAPQLLPTLELQQLSVRAQGRELGFLTENAFPPVMALNLLLPGVFGNNVTGFKGGDPFQEVFIYVGFIPLWLAVAGLAGFFGGGRRPAGDRLFFGLLLVEAAALALGDSTPLYRSVVQHLPGFALFRIPSRWLMGVSLALAILAGLGLERILARGLSRRRLALFLAAAFAVCGGVWLAGRLGPGWLAANGSALGEVERRLAVTFLDRVYTVHPAYRQRLLLGPIAGLTAPGILLTANTLIAAVLASLFAARRLSRSALAVLLVGAVSFDLVVAGGVTVNPTRPETWWRQLSGGAEYVREHMAEGRVFPLGMGSEAATVSHLGQYFPSVYRIRSAGGHGSSLRLARYDTFLHETDPVQSIQVLGVRYLLTLGQMGADVASTYPLVYSDPDSYVYENPRPLPRAFIVHQAIRAAGPAEALAYFQGRSIDPGRTVILEAAEDGQRPPIPAGSAAAGTAAIVSEQPQAVTIRTQAEAEGYLVLLDTFYPGWTATVDGQRTPIYRANYVGRAVFLPAGEHRVRFEYRPLSFKVGQLLALLALLVLAAVAFRSSPAAQVHSSSSSSSSQSSSSPSSASSSQSSNSSRSSNSSSSRPNSSTSSSSSSTTSSSSSKLSLGSSNSSSSR